MPTVDLTIGGNQYKSYASLDEANEYLAADLRFGAAWGAMEDSAKSVALAYATRRVDSLSYSGSKADSNQANEFPREGQSDIPAEVKQATILLAGYYSSVPQAQSAPTDRRLRKFRVGDFETEFFDRPVAESGGELEFTDAADLLAPFLVEASTESFRGSRVNAGGNSAINPTDWAGRLA